MSIKTIVVNLNQLRRTTLVILTAGVLSGLWLGLFTVYLTPGFSASSLYLWGLVLSLIGMLVLWGFLYNQNRKVLNRWIDNTRRLISEESNRRDQTEIDMVESVQTEKARHLANCRHNHICKTINELHALVSRHLTSVTKETNDAALNLINQLSMIHSDMTHLLQTVSDNQNASKKISDGSITTLENNTETMDRLEHYIEHRIGEIDKDHQIVRDLQQQASLMSEMTKMIETVAKQTTILATNAKIEATRAGAHGQAFGVIADEVTNLSAQIGNASKQIIESIDNMAKSIDQKFSEKLDQANQRKETELLNNLKDQLHLMEESYLKLEEFNRETLLNINQSSEHTKSKVNDSLVAIQFQDMTQQQIEIVLKSFRLFEQYLSNETCFDLASQGESNFKDFDIEQIRRLYVMKKQRDIHDKVKRSAPLTSPSADEPASDDIILF